QTFFSLIIIFLLLMFFPFLDKIFFKTNASLIEFYLTTFSVLFFIWQNYIINSLNANKKFFESNFILNLSNVIKTIFIIILIKINSVSVATIIFTLGILGPTAFFLILFFKKFQTIKNVFKAKIDKKQFYFNYTISFFIASQFFNLALRMDLFLLSFYFPQSAQVGYYGLAQKIILTIMASIISVTQVLSPNFSKMKTKEEIKKQLKTGFLYLLAPVFLFILLYYTPEWVFTLFFTKKYDQAIIITKQLALAFIPYVFLNLPILFLLYTVKKTLPILIENIVFFITLTLGCYFFIPYYGVLAPPKIIFFSFILALIITTIFSIKEYQKIS
ncbi:MAG: lipopolysaccharide biosynthesis protein, partial [Microgenomates group bacterium]